MSEIGYKDEINKANKVENTLIKLSNKTLPDVQNIEF